MSEEQINIAIAEACGQTEVSDYCNDLNAMHGAEKTLDDDHLYIYGNILDYITRKAKIPMSYVHKPEAGMYPELFRATAHQRAEAFLKTINKWEGGSDDN
jgi:hypothetical protein